MSSKRGRRAHVPNATLTAREVVDALVRPLAIDDAERWIGSFLGVDAVLFASARGALAAAVDVLADGDDVAIPAYTCAAVANAIIATGRRPRFVDVDERGVVPVENWPEDVLVVAQDTYGFSAALPKGRRVIRDAAHRPPLGNLDEAAVTITSFEHSKWISAGQGGLALTRDLEIAAKLRRRRDCDRPGTNRWTHAFVTLLALVVGRLHYGGRFALADPFNRAAYKVGGDRFAGQSDVELQGQGIDATLAGAPNRSVARLMQRQIERIPSVSKHRARIVSIYDRRAAVVRTPEPLVRYPLIVDDPACFEQWFLEHGWDVRGRWFSSPLHPAGTDLRAFGYVEGQAPIAEKLAATVVNLPTHPFVSDEDADELIGLALECGARPLVAKALAAV